MGEMKLKDRVHVEELNRIPVSGGQIWDQEKTVVFTKDEAVILDMTKFSLHTDDIKAIVPRNKRNGLCESSTLTARLGTTVKVKQSENINLWHQRLVHAHVKVFK